MTNYFTTTQRSILKYAWIPVILTIFIYFGFDYWMRNYYMPGRGAQNRPWIVMLTYLPATIAIGYDMLMRKNGLQFMLMLLAALCMNGCIFWLNSSPIFFKPEVINGFWFNFTQAILLFLLFLARAYLLKLKRPWVAGLLAILVFTFVAPLGNNIDLLVDKLDNAFFWDEIVSLPFRGMYPFVLLTGLALVDNLTHTKGYFKKLGSKVQVIGAKEYIVLYFVTIWICSLSIFEMGTEFDRRQLFSLICTLICSIAAGYLLRNILMSRMTTIGSSNGWLYVLHYVFLLNIIPVTIWGKASTVHETTEENAAFYLLKEPSSVGIAIMWVGCMAGLIAGISLAFNYYMGWAALMLLYALIYPFLNRFRQAVYGLISINIISVICILFLSNFSVDGTVLFLFLMFTYLTAHVLIEVFHPRLNGKDALPVQVLSV